MRVLRSVFFFGGAGLEQVCWYFCRRCSRSEMLVLFVEIRYWDSLRFSVLCKCHD